MALQPPVGPLAALSVAAFVGCAALAFGPLDGMAHVSDEVNYLLQARIFADGGRTAETPAYWYWRAPPYLFLHPRMYSAFPPGWPLVLAVGVKLGVPFLVNPLLAAALPWAGWMAFRRVLGPATLLACTVLAVSPAVLVLGGSLMSHTSVLLALLLAAAGAQGSRGALGGGLALGFVALARPYDAALVAIPLVVWSRRLPYALGAGLGVLVLLADNTLLTGSPWRFPIDAWVADPGSDWFPTMKEGCNRLGLGPDRGCHGPGGFDLADARRNVEIVGGLADRLFLGFRGSLLLALLGLPALARRAPALAAVAILVPAGYAFYWYHGACYGGRFWTAAFLGFVPAAALVLESIRARVGRWVWALVVVGPISVMPALFLEVGDRYWCVDDQPRELAAGIRDGVILLRDRGSFPADMELTAPDGLVCTPGLSGNGALAWDDGPTWLIGVGDGVAQARAVEAETPGVPIRRLTRDLVTGEATLETWDGATFR